MEYALKKKFKNNTHWGEKLKRSTGEIVEFNNWGDTFWGVDIYTSKGQNHLGKLLTKIKNEL